MGFSNSLCKSFCWYESFRSFHDVFTLLFGADHLIEIPITEFGHGVCSSEKPQDYIVSCIVFNLFLVSSRIFPYKATTSLECRLKRLCCLLSEWLWLTLKYWWAERPSTVLRCLYGHINVRVVVQAIFTFADPIDWALDGVRRMVQAVWMSTTGKKARSWLAGEMVVKQGLSNVWGIMYGISMERGQVVWTSRTKRRWT